MAVQSSRLVRVRDWLIVVTCLVVLVYVGVSAYVFVNVMNRYTADVVAPAEPALPPALTGESCTDMLDGECR